MMMARLLDWSSRRRRVVVAAALALALVGAYARRSLPRDAIPDLSDPQIVIVVRLDGAPGHRDRREDHERPHQRLRRRAGRDGGARDLDAGHGLRRRRLWFAGEPGARSGGDRARGSTSALPDTGDGAPAGRPARLEHRLGVPVRAGRYDPARVAARSCVGCRTTCCGRRCRPSPASPRSRRSAERCDSFRVEVSPDLLRERGLAVHRRARGRCARR